MYLVRYKINRFILLIRKILFPVEFQYRKSTFEPLLSRKAAHMTSGSFFPTANEGQSPGSAYKIYSLSASVHHISSADIRLSGVWVAN
jgi:hypothetical protein